MVASLWQDHRRGDAMRENEIAREIVDACYRVHTGLGPGLLVNFGEARIKDGLQRVVNGLPEEQGPQGDGTRDS